MPVSESRAPLLWGRPALSIWFWFSPGRGDRFRSSAGPSRRGSRRADLAPPLWAGSGRAAPSASPVSALSGFGTPQAPACPRAPLPALTARPQPAGQEEPALLPPPLPPPRPPLCPPRSRPPPPGGGGTTGDAADIPRGLPGADTTAAGPPPMGNHTHAAPPPPGRRKNPTPRSPPAPSLQSPPPVLYEVTKERGAWPHFQVVDVAVQGLRQTEDELRHAAKSPPEGLQSSLSCRYVKVRLGRNCAPLCRRDKNQRSAFHPLRKFNATVPFLKLGGG